ncbi:vWA domain-containing protein [Vibrio sp. TBV020]|uniref:vWA domain-containing protein n=1 Tax=Vibrio sp. TBV020 TaxID=3137398 RepID=UPI0038CD37DF
MFDFMSLEQLFTQFHFIRPLWLIALIPMAGLLWLRFRFESKPGWRDVLPAHLRDALTIGEHGWKKQLPLKLLMVIVTLAIIICAGPSWQREASPFGEDKASMLVVLDNSDTMLQTDLAPNRLERAKHKIRDLLELRKGGSTGLIVYAGSAHIAMPVTQDIKVFNPFLAAITPEIMPVEGKSAQSALPLIEQQLNHELGSSVLLVTDGVTPFTIDAYEKFFIDSPYQLLILAAGNQSVQSNNPVDIASLKELANRTGGHLIELSVDDSDVKKLDSYVERNMQLNGESSMPWKDMGYGLLFPIIVIMLLWFRKGWLVQWCLTGLIFTSVTLSPSSQAENVYYKAEVQSESTELTWADHASQFWWDLWLTPDQQGQRWFDKHEYLKAAQHYQSPLYKGTAYYYASEFKLAHGAFLEMESPLGYYNAASALARQREYLAARDLLKQLLLETDLDSELKGNVDHNLAVLNSIVEEINRVSESQAGTTDGPEESFELDDKPRTADGAEEETIAELMLKETLNANEILGSDELADKWLRRVEANPKYFLRAKFQIQLHAQSNGAAKDTQ